MRADCMECAPASCGARGGSERGSLGWVHVEEGAGGEVHTGSVDLREEELVEVDVDRRCRGCQRWCVVFRWFVVCEGCVLALGTSLVFSVWTWRVVSCSPSVSRSW